MITEEELIRMLDGFAESDTGRLKVLILQIKLQI